MKAGDERLALHFGGFNDTWPVKGDSHVARPTWKLVGGKYLKEPIGPARALPGSWSTEGIASRSDS